MPAALTHRLQVLIDEDRYARLRREAERTGAPVGAIVRDAIDARIGSPSDRDAMAVAARHILDSPRPDGREPDWEEGKEKLLDGLYGVE